MAKRTKMDLSDYEVSVIFPEGEEEAILMQMQYCYVKGVLDYGITMEGLSGGFQQSSEFFSEFFGEFVQRGADNK